MPAPILILGVPRSGTSLLAELTATWGAFTGPQATLLQADAWNKRGYYEYRPVLKVVDSILKNRLVPDDIELDPYVPAARAAIRSMLDGAPAEKPCLWKAPRMSPLLPFWEQQIEAETGELPFVIVAVRNPVDSALSQKRYFEQKTLKAEVPDFPLAPALLIWQYYMAFLLNNTAPERTIFVSMEDLVANRDAVLRLKARLDRFYGIAGNDRMVDIPQQSMVNLTSSDLTILTATQRGLYACLGEQTRTQTIFSDPEWIHCMPTALEMEQILKMEQWYGNKIAEKLGVFNQS